MMGKIPARCITTVANGIRSLEEMLGPKSLPVIGNLWRYLPVIGHYSFEKLHQTYAAMYKTYGPIVREHVYGDRVIVHVYDPNDMWNVYKSCSANPVRISHTVLAKYREKRPHLYNGPGLFPSNGEEWHRIRQLFQKIFLLSENVNALTGELEKVTDDLVAKLPSCLDSNNEVEMLPLLIRFALESIGVVAINKRLGCLSDNPNAEILSLIKAAGDTHSAVYNAENSPPLMRSFSYKKLEAAQNLLSRVISNYLEETIKERKDGKRTDSMLDKMLDIKDVDKRDVFGMVIDLFMAGIDTTAYATSFVLYNLAKYKIVQERLRSELVKVLPSKDTRIPNDASSLPYLKAVVNESLRVNALAIGTGRILQMDLNLSGYRVPANTMVILQHQVAGMLPQHFPNPHEFKPERWMNREFPPLVSSPFGFGSRACVGKKIALREIHIGVAKLIRNFEVDYFHEDIDTINRLINVPDKSVQLRLKSIDY